MFKINEEDIKKIVQPKTIKSKSNGCDTALGNLVQIYIVWLKDIFKVFFVARIIQMSLSLYFDKRFSIIFLKNSRFWSKWAKLFFTASNLLSLHVFGSSTVCWRSKSRAGFNISKCLPSLVTTCSRAVSRTTCSKCW